MPVSKHRRKGKLRPRQHTAPLSWRLPPLSPEEQAEHDAELAIDRQNEVLINARLKEIFGGEAWSDAQFMLAHDELEAEGALLPVPGRDRELTE